MNIELFWKDIRVMIVKRINNLYITNVDINNLNKLEENGFPLFLIKNIRVISNELPQVVKHRIVREKNNGIKLNKEALAYINTSSCHSPINKFTLKIELNSIEI